MNSSQAHAGFSLLELSMVLIIIASVTGGTLMMGVSAMESARRAQTNNKLNQIEDTLMTYRTVNERLPCPADASMVEGNVNYGVEAANAGSCTGGTPAANFSDATNHVVEGAVPVKTLGLPNEFMYDGWGRKFAYAVNQYVTATRAMASETLSDACLITVTDAAGGKRSDAGAIYTLVSFGPDGHGGYLSNGSRFSSGSADADEQTNCHCTGSAVATAYSAAYVQKDATATFDDFVRFKERWQMQTSDDGYLAGGASVCNPQDGFRIDGSQVNGLAAWSIATGDVNGDGLPDIAISARNGINNEPTVYIVFGTSAGFPNPLPLGSLDGSIGFALYAGAGGGIYEAVAVADVDRDGYDDIVMGTGNMNNNGAYGVVFYGSAGPFTGGTAGINNSAYEVGGLTACQGFGFDNGNNSGTFGFAVAAGDVNGDGIPDIVVSDASASSNKGEVYVIFGQAGAKSCPNTGPFPAAVHANTLTSATSPKGATISGNSVTQSFGFTLSVGNLNKDGYGDIVIGDAFYNSGNGRVAVISGQPAGQWPNAISIASLAGIPAGGGGACPPPYNTCGSLIVGDGTIHRFGTSVATGDVTGDSIVDLLIGSDDNASGGNGVALIKGANSAWLSSYSLAGPAGTAFKFTSAETPGYTVGIGDVNNDGVSDVLFNDTTITAHGSVYVLFGPISGSRNLDGSPPTGGTDGVRIDCPYTSNGWGWWNSCGMNGLITADVNHDGTQDTIIGVNDGNVTGSNQEGYSYVVFGKSSAWSASYNLSTIK